MLETAAARVEQNRAVDFARIERSILPESSGSRWRVVATAAAREQIPTGNASI